MGIIRQQKSNRYKEKIKKQMPKGRNYRHIIGLVSAITGIFLLVALVNISLIKGYRHLLKSTLFDITCIEVEGNQHVKKDEILKLSGIRPRQNLLTLDIKKVSKKITSHPWISACQIIQHLPSAITIKVTEREPIALVNMNKLYYLDKNGEVFGPWHPDDLLVSKKLPVITGLDKDKQIQNSTIKVIKSLIEEINIEGEWPSELNFSSPDKVTVFLAPSGRPIVMNTQDIQKELANLNWVIKGLKAMEKWMVTDKIRLDIGDYAVVSLKSNTKKF